jgi:hypothetical protein
VHLPAVTTAAGTAPLKFNSGTVMTTPENGAFEWDGTHLYFTQSGARTDLLTVASGANTALSNLSAVAINAALVLGTTDAFALGSTTKQWSDLFLAEGGVINWDNGDATLTQAGNVVTLGGADLAITNLTASLPVLTDSSKNLISDQISLATQVKDYLPTVTINDTSTSRPFVSTDAGKLVTYSNTSAVAASLSADTGAFGAGWSVKVQNRNTGIVTITPAGTIGGAATLLLYKGWSATITSDGTGDYKVQVSAPGIVTIPFAIGNGVDTLTNGQSSFPVPIPFAGKIVGYCIQADAGTATLKFWKKATGTAIPTISDVINTSGVSLSTGTQVFSATVSDFTTVEIAVNDSAIGNITAVATAKYVVGSLLVAKYN